MMIYLSLLSIFSTIQLVVSFGLRTVSPVQRGYHALRMQSNDEFTVAILGDLHLDPRYMQDHIEGQKHIVERLKVGHPTNRALVSLGDLGESKSVDETSQLFSGTSACFKLAREYFDGFGVPFEVVTGNHDLEGIDEFDSDEKNMQAFLQAFDKKSPQFVREVAEKTLLVGLSSVTFRTALYTSHEVFVDDEQVKWFEDLVKTHPAEEGWKLFVFTHAPPIGSGLRVLQENHVVNGCCWLNHSHKSRRKFIDLVRSNRCIKAWFSGHFHLGQDYEDSITFPEGNNRGSCVFAQTAVIAKKSSRDTRRQSRMIRGNKDGFQIFTINHAKDGEERLDATVTYTENNSESVVFAHPHEDYDHAAWFSAYTPKPEDGCYIGEQSLTDITFQGKPDVQCWWHMVRSLNYF